MSLLFFLPSWKSIFRSIYFTAGFNTVTETIATFGGIFFFNRVLFLTLFRRSLFGGKNNKEREGKRRGVGGGGRESLHAFPSP